MDVLKALNEARAVMMRWEAATVVWHRASGRRGLVDGWKICADGTCLISVTYGDGAGIHYVFELSQTRVADNEDGEDWKTEDQKK